MKNNDYGLEVTCDDPGIARALKHNLYSYCRAHQIEAIPRLVGRTNVVVQGVPTGVLESMAEKYPGHTKITELAQI